MEAWLRGQGRLLEVPLVERAWQELRTHAGDDLRLAAALADAGERLVSGQAAEPHAVAELAAAIGPADAFEVLLSRFHETRAHSTAVPAAEIAELMAALARLPPPSGRGQPGERWITVRTGDIVVAASAADRLTARVVTTQSVILGPGLTLLRVDPERLDAHFVAGALRSSANGQVATRQVRSSGRADISRAQIAQLPLPEQRPYGEVFRQADELESAARSATAMGASLAQLLADGTAGGTLEPSAGRTNSL